MWSSPFGTDAQATYSVKIVGGREVMVAAAPAAEGLMHTAPAIGDQTCVPRPASIAFHGCTC